MRSPRLLPTALALVLLFPASVSAQQTIAPPGKAGADQYFETIPSGVGNAKPPQGSGATGSPSANSRSAGVATLARSGKDGRAAAAFAASSAPRTAHVAIASSGSGDSPSSTALRPIGGTDAGGLGIALPILLATVAIAAAALALTRRRQDSRAL